ncbi:MAG: EamA family transporter, partial [Nitrospira sp.]|nr:EamA family transporter [Nitrospira sp.]
TYFTALTIFFAPIAFWRGRKDLGHFITERQYRHLITPGIFYGLMAATHMIAMKLTKVAYMISVKRLSLLIGITYGYFLFKEENFRERLLGAILMFIGFVMIVTAG